MQDTKITKQEEIGDILMSLGMNRTVASVLAYMQDKEEEVFRTDFETAARMRQPEVSITMKELEERGWIKVWDYKKLGKGRPAKAYTLKIPFKNIIAELEEQQRKTEAGVQAKIERLKGLARAS